MSYLYPKISSPYKRHTEGPLRNRLNLDEWARPEFAVLADATWTWTEKVDGTNVRIMWDGYKVTFGGRTDNAQMQTSLLTVLTDLFPETLLEQQFGQTPATLFGEGYGPKIQKGGGNYRQDQSFVLFDVKVGSWWLLPESVAEVAQQMSLDVVPVILEDNVTAAIKMVTLGLDSHWGNFRAEGLVGRPPYGLMARDGDRLMMKIKSEDFRSEV